MVGIIGPRTSRESVMVSSLLSLFHIPVLAPYSTSDELSDKSRYEYFMSLVPPDSYQAQAIVDVCIHYGWTHAYISCGENGESRYKEKPIRKESASHTFEKSPLMLLISFMKKL